MGNCAGVSGHSLDATAEGVIFDAHCSYYDFLQETEGAPKLMEAMEAASVASAAIFGNALKKAHVTGEKPPEHEVFDDGELYYFSATDYRLAVDLAKLPPRQRERLALCVCGVNLGDQTAPKHLLDVLADLPDTKAVGELVLRGGLKTNMVLRGAGAALRDANLKKVFETAEPRRLPFILKCNACARRGWSDRRTFQYLEELSDVATARPGVMIIWKAAGIFLGGCWDGYMAKLVEFLNGHRNVHISVTAGILDHPTFKQDDFISLCANFPNRVVLGTTARGYFTKKQETAWEKKGYMEQCRRLHQFADILAERFGTDVARAVRFGNAARLFGMPGANDGTLSSIALDQHPVVTPEAPEDGLHEDHKARVNMAAHYGSGKCSTMQKHLESAPSSLTTQAPSLAPAGKKEWESVDCHFHLFDFSQKSCGTAAALRALDEAKAEKAVLLGIPCCKKWNSNQKECPLFYTDDNAPCYFYSFADQMMVDAWLALPDKSRRRLAPLISGFDPTDKNSINHVKRTYEKYPRLWRGLGEIMCRHDDLTSTMMNKEVPVPNHPALDSIYTFCCEKQLPVMVHSNADRVAHKSTGRLEYAPEVTSVLDRFPSLIFIWCHAGVSRQTADQHQAHHIDDLMTKYPNLHADISWVVWEQSICDENGEIKQDWLDVIEKHSDRFMIGSDNTGQFWTPDLKKNTLKGQITKYWPLYEKLSPQAAQRVSCGNGERIFFSSWTVPLSTDEDARYHTGPRCYPCEFLDMFEREYIPGQGDDAMF